jgi:dihydroflavonol-4-reductase
MNILITGAGGFIGSHLVDSQLAQGHKVRAVDLHLDLLAHQKDHPCLETISGDITDAELVKQIVDGVNIVYHLASAHLDVSLSDAHYRRVNAGATVALLEASLEAGVNRFVHCSSVGVIGDVENPPASETANCRPTNIYEQTKLEGERAAIEFASRTGFPVVVMRPAWVYGSRCPRTAKLLRMLKKGRFLFFGKGRNFRHPVYISDAVQGLELCASVRDMNGEIFIIAGENPVTVSQLVSTMSTALGVSPPKIHLPIWLGLLAGYGLEFIFKLMGKKPPFSRRSLDFFLKHNAYDIGKAKRLLGYQPQVDLADGILKTIQQQP